MAPKRPATGAAATASGSASNASDAEGDAGHQRRRRHSPSPARTRSRSRSKTPPTNLRPNVAALSATPISTGADYAAASDSDADGRDQSPRRRRERYPTPRSYSDADAAGRVPSPRRDRQRSPRLYSDSDSDADAAAGGRVSSLRRSRDRSPRLHSEPDNSGATEGGGEGNVSPLPRARRSTRIETSNIKPVSSRLMDEQRRSAGAASSQRRSKRRLRSPALPSAEHNKRPPRVWSPEDEVTILRALIAFQGKKGRLPSSIQDAAKLESQIGGQLIAKASTTQLSDKIRRLKHKYKLLAIRAKKGREPDLEREPDLPMDHEREVYELSKKVWGAIGTDGFTEVGGSLTYENAGDEESNEEQEIEESDEGMDSGWDVRDRPKKLKAFSENGSMNAIAGNGNVFATGCRSKASQGGGGGKDYPGKGQQMYPYLWGAVEELSKNHPSGQIFRKAFGVLEKAKARVMEEKLRKFRMSEIRQQLRRMDLMKETVTMVLDALEGTG